MLLTDTDLGDILDYNDFKAITVFLEYLIEMLPLGFRTYCSTNRVSLLKKSTSNPYGDEAVRPRYENFAVGFNDGH